MKLGYDSTSSGRDRVKPGCFWSIYLRWRYIRQLHWFLSQSSRTSTRQRVMIVFLLSLPTFLKIKSIEVYCTLPLAFYRWTERSSRERGFVMNILKIIMPIAQQCCFLKISCFLFGTGINCESFVISLLTSHHCKCLVVPCDTPS